MDDIVVATHWWRNTWGATKEASVVGRLSSCCLGIIIISFSYLFCCFCFCVPENWPKKALDQVSGGFCYYITMTTICLLQLLLCLGLFRCASISWFQVVSQSVSHTFLQLAHLRVFQSYSLMRKNWPKKALVQVIGEGLRWRNTKTLWSRAWGRNWLRYERQFKLQSRISSSDAKCWCHTL